MSGREKKTRTRINRRHLIGMLVLAGLVVAVVCWKQGNASPQDGELAHASIPAAHSGPQSPALTEPSLPSDYAKRVVAYIYQDQAVTRQQLGDYLIARGSEEKLDVLINHKIVEKLCQGRGITVTAAEVEAALQESLDSVVGVPKDQFLKQILKQYKKNLYEWKEDVIRMKLMLNKLCRDRVTCTNEEVNKAFEALHGERVQCRVILWPHDKRQDAVNAYPRIRDDEEAFRHEAKHQSKKGFAASGGRIKPIARYSLNDAKVEAVALNLKEGEVSELLDTEDGIMLLKCDQKIPADTSVDINAIRDRLTREVYEAKLTQEIPVYYEAVKKQAGIKKFDVDLTQPGEPNQVLAVIGGDTPVTREELGEFCIARHGAERLELMVNGLIISHEAAQRGIHVSDEEVEAEFRNGLKKLGVEQSVFVKEYLHAQGRTLYEWKEDNIRQQLLMEKMFRPQVQATEEDIQQAFDAYHGERVECRMIMWPTAEKKLAMLEYDAIRGNEEAFIRKAKMQANTKLASRGGKLDQPIGRNTTGDPDLEKEIFRLQPGEMSPLIETPHGTVMLLCEKKLPPDESVKLEQVKERLMQEVIERKLQVEIPRFFAELRQAADPQLLLAPSHQFEDLATSVEKEIKEIEQPTLP